MNLMCVLKKGGLQLHLEGEVEGRGKVEEYL